MLIETIGSGSKGNGYVIKVGDEYLLLECGMPTKDMLKAINFQTQKVVGCLVSHEHFDHYKYAKDYVRYGFPVYMTEESRPEGFAGKTLRRMKKQMIGRFSIVPFGVPHNGTECDGFLIIHPDFGKILFITDAEMCPYDFSRVGINHLMVECNYAEDYVEMTDENRDHVLLGHMELETCRRFIRSVYSDKLMSIGLIHISNDHGDRKEFESSIQQEFSNIKVWTAQKNAVVEV